MSQPTSRRIFLKLAGTGALAPVAGSALGQAAQGGHGAAHESAAAPNAPPTYLFFNAPEAAFIEAAVQRLIPPDDVGPGALEAGVPFFIDKQLHGAWGAGERLYRSGPWRQGAPTQGYQLPFTPAELFRNALRGVRLEGERGGRGPFERWPGDAQDAYLTQLQTTDRDLEGVPARVFFESLLSMTIEGYFSDPVYGGNFGMASWHMLGFPGAYAAYYELVDQHGLHFDAVPRSLAQTGSGHVHVMPNIPADVGGVHPAQGRASPAAQPGGR